MNNESALQLQQWLPEVCMIAYAAGQEIARFYHLDDVGIEQKQDGTPVTDADLAADKMICQALAELTPNIPIVSEESVAQIPFSERQTWQTYWLIDPLDGTKEFIDKTGEYSVNIALIDNHHPVLGVIYGPELGNMYFASHSAKAGKLAGLLPIGEGVQSAMDLHWPSALLQAKALKVSGGPLQRRAQQLPVRVAVSRRHGSALQRFMSQLGYAQQMHMGSALKACMVAEGSAEVYPRFGPTSLWDTAASQCIVEAAGGAILNAAGHSLEYVQSESMLNPFFAVVCDARYSWPSFPEIL